jgi:hypothetical protein
MAQGESLPEMRRRDSVLGINTRRDPIIFVWNASIYYQRWKIYAKKNIVV